MQEVVEYLKKKKKTIATMESASGGQLASAITNIKGSSFVFQFGAVTYSNEFKIKMGVREETIAKYSVYSLECAKEMSLKIAEFTNADYAVGITGKINDVDPNNDFGSNSEVFLSLYDKEEDKYYTKIIEVKPQSRELNKELIVKEFVKLFKEEIIQSN